MSKHETLRLMTTDHFAVAQDHIDDVHEAIERVESLHHRGATKVDIAIAYDDIRQGLKLAEISALLYIGDRLDSLVRTIDAQRLTADDVDNLVQSAFDLGRPA